VTREGTVTGIIGYHTRAEAGEFSLKKSFSFCKLSSHVATRFLMKLFNTNDMEIINTCREEFEFSLPSQQISVRYAKFMESDGAKIDIMIWYCVQL